MSGTENFDTGYDVYFLVVKDLERFREWYQKNRDTAGDDRVKFKDGSRYATVKEWWPTLRKLALLEFPNADWIKVNNEPFLEYFNASDWAKSWLGRRPADVISGVGKGIIDFNILPCWSPSQIRVLDAEWHTYVKEYDSVESLNSELRLSEESLQIVQVDDVDDGRLRVVLKRRSVAVFTDRKLPGTREYG